MDNRIVFFGDKLDERDATLIQQISEKIKKSKNQVMFEIMKYIAELGYIRSDILQLLNESLFTNPEIGYVLKRMLAMQVPAGWIKLLYAIEKQKEAAEFAEEIEEAWKQNLSETEIISLENCSLETFREKKKSLLEQRKEQEKKQQKYEFLYKKLKEENKQLKKELYKASIAEPVHEKGQDENKLSKTIKELFVELREECQANTEKVLEQMKILQMSSDVEKVQDFWSSRPEAEKYKIIQSQEEYMEEESEYSKNEEAMAEDIPSEWFEDIKIEPEEFEMITEDYFNDITEADLYEEPEKYEQKKAPPDSTEEELGESLERFKLIKEFAKKLKAKGLQKRFLKLSEYKQKEEIFSQLNAKHYDNETITFILESLNQDIPVEQIYKMLMEELSLENMKREIKSLKEE